MPLRYQMGIESIDEDFWPVTPVRTVSARQCNHIIKLSDGGDHAKELLRLDHDDDDHQDCHTPKSETQVLKPPLVCPPAPRKPRPTRRRSGPPRQAFLQVPEDLASIFLVLSQPSKRIRAS